MPAMDYDRVAHLYDAYVQTELDIPFFREEAKRAGGPVLELMCGTGRVSLPLLEAGVDLTCVDSSAGMLEIFRGKLRGEELSAEVIEADVCKLSLGRQFDLIFIPFHSFAEIIDPAQQRKALQAIHAHLSPTGRFICTLHNPPVRLKSVTGQQRRLGDFPLPDGATLSLSSVEHYEAPSGHVTGTQFYEVRCGTGRVLVQTAIDIRFCLLAKEAFEALAELSGLSPVLLYGDYARTPFHLETSPFMVWILKKA